MTTNNLTKRSSITGLLLWAFMILMLIFNPSSCHAADEPTSLALAEQIIRAKAATTDVLPGYTPALIYQVIPNSQDLHLMGMGTIHKEDNELQLVTASRIFSASQTKSPRANFVVHALRPVKGVTARYAISAINDDDHNFIEWKTQGDVVRCTLGPASPSIECFYDESAVNKKEGATTDFVFVSRRLAKQAISLLTGETIPLVGYLEFPSKKFSYLVAIADVQEKEIGSGFMDETGTFCILKGKLEPGFISAQIQKEFGYPEKSAFILLVRYSRE